VKKPKIKSQPSVVDQLPPYDVSEDILKLPSSATVGQMLQYPSQRRNLVKILKRPKKTVETNYLQSENDSRKTSSAKCYVRIKGNPVIAILDSGAAVSIITNKLMHKLRLEPDSPSKTIVITANGNRVRALGQITKAQICIQDLIIPIKLQVIESQEETLLLGIDWFQKTRAKWNFGSQTLQIQYDDKTVKIGTTHFIDEIPLSITDSENSNDELEEIEYDDEDLEEQETYYSDHAKRNETLEEYEETNSQAEENPAIYLSDHVIDQEPKPEIGIVTPEQQEIVDQIIKENEDVFVEHISKEGQTQDLGRTSVITHSIDTGNAKPIKQRPYRTSPDQQEFIKNEIGEMLKKGIISPTSSPWASPVVVVPKKNGKKRFCIDFRKLNEVTEKDVYPLPVIDDLLDSFQGSKWFTCLDLASGYWQVAMNDEDKKKTAFTTKYGLYEFNVMPFGLCNAPATFQRLMDELLRPYKGNFVEVYIDDITIFSKTFQDHCNHVNIVLDVLRQANLKLNMEKCFFFLTSVKLLGHEINREGVMPDDDKIVKVRDFPRPMNIRQLRGFLGLASYYRKFIANFSTIAKPLNQLLEKQVPFEWTEIQEKSFQMLKRYLITAPILRYPNFNQPFYLHTDASGTGLGAVLAQKEGKQEYAIAYASRSLTKPERNYSTTEQECLAVIWAVEHFHQYLGTNRFYLVTDHSALQWLKTSELKGRRARWILRLEPYNYTVIHRAGRKHNNADAMSRMYEDQEPIFYCKTEEDPWEIETTSNLWNEDQEFDPQNPERIEIEFIGEFYHSQDSEEDYRPNRECITKDQWFIAGQYCKVCQERAEDHHTHKFCIECNNICDKNRYPFKDQCTCKGKQRIEDDVQSTTTISTQIILDQIHPRPLKNYHQSYRRSDYNFYQIPRTRLSEEEFEEPIQLSDDYWWLSKLEQPSRRHKNEFNNYSKSYLCNSAWWMDTNPVTYY
jgi:hypothetical protein